MTFWDAKPTIISPLYPRKIILESEMEIQDAVGDAEKTLRILAVPWGGVDFEKSSSRQIVTLFHLIGTSWSDFTPRADTIIGNQELLIDSAAFKDSLRI